MSKRIAKKVLLIGWDAADWRVIHPMMDAGKLPHLQRLIERGSMGNITTLRPVLSPMLWTSIATGKRAYKHGILGFVEPSPDGTNVRPVSILSRKTKAFWNILNQSGLKTNVVGWWPSAPAEPIDGVVVTNLYHKAGQPIDQPWPMPPGIVHPPRLTETLKGLRFHPSELIDEQVLPFLPRASEINQDKDRRLSSVMRVLAECVTVHNAATWLLANEPCDVMAIYYDAIDHFCHGFMRYHPPRQDFISERDFALYSGVVEAAYRFHDMMLGATLAMVDDDTHVILLSDHGFHPDVNRPADIPDEPAGPAVEHRDVGILAIAGPGIRRDALIHGASLLDITPTLLTLLGLPIGEDMDGKPLLQAFEAPPEIESIPSWDAVAGPSGEHDPAKQSDPLASQEAIRQLVELGYVEALDADREKSVARVTAELRFNLARAYMDAALHREAVPILQALYETYPDENRYGLQLALCYRALEWIDHLRPLIETIHERRMQQAKDAAEELTRLQQEHDERKAAAKQAGQEHTLSDDERRKVHSLRGRARVRGYDVVYLRGYVAAAEGNHEQAIQLLREAEKANPNRAGLHVQIGESYLRLRQWDQAMNAFRRGIELDSENPHAHLGVARAHLRHRRGADAAEAAIRAVSLDYHFPMAHFVLGQALAQLGRYAQAAEALEVALQINPNFAHAHRRIAQLYGRFLDQPEKATEHRRLAREIRRAGKNMPVAPDIGHAPTNTESTNEPHLTTTGATSVVDDACITIVTGLPRSGTSMMMQMLAAGGLPVLTDRKREADEDNPRGYYELEDATRLRTSSDWLRDAGGQGVKIVAQLLPHLPNDYGYRVIFMQRDIEEVLASQETMLQRHDRTSGDAESLRVSYGQQLRQVKQWLARHNVPTIFVTYADTLADPQATADALAAFLGDDQDPRAMAGVVTRDLYRQRRKP